MKFNQLLLLLLVALSLSACLTTKTNVGSFREDTGETYVYAKSKQLWLFYGLIPLGRTQVSTPMHGNCQVITRYTFTDFLLAGVTLGMVTSYTIKVKTKRGSSDRMPPRVDRY
jgi:hypothetical protein